jgi:HPt (histidine-containing phosphotransfer) domain-containing protein
MGKRPTKSTGSRPSIDLSAFPDFDLSTIQDLDLSTMEDLADGDIAVLAELVAMFKRNTNEALAKARAAIAAGQPDDLMRVAHTSIGFTASLGLTTMVPILRQIEQAAGLELPLALWVDELTPLVERWKQEFERIYEALRS